MTENLSIYLSYADDVEKADPVMAVCCRLYYVESYLKQVKQHGGSELSAEDKLRIAEILGKAEQEQSVNSLSNEQKKEKVAQYCTKMHNKIMQAIKTQHNKMECIDMLTTMRNFVQVLTSFGPLSAEWLKIGCLGLTPCRRGVQNFGGDDA